MRVLFDDRDTELLAHGLHVVVPDVAERFRVRLEAEVGDAPALKQPREDIGGLAPERRKDIAALGLRAMIAGNLAAFISASIAGMLA